MNKINLFLVICSMLSCNSTKNINQVSSTCNNIKDAYFQHWIGGQAQSGSGTNLQITFSDTITSKRITKIYFQNQVVSPQVVNSNQIVALLVTKTPDLILESNPQDEYGNQPPVIDKNQPLLKENEAVLEYLVNKKTYWCKISNIKEKELLAYPSARPRN